MQLGPYTGQVLTYHGRGVSCYNMENEMCPLDTKKKQKKNELSFLYRVHTHNNHSHLCIFHWPNLYIRCTSPIASLG